MSNSNRDTFSPWKTLLFLLAVAGVIGIGTLLELDGLKIGQYALRYPTAEDFKTVRGQSVDMDQLLEDYHEIDLMDDTVILHIDTTQILPDTTIQDTNTAKATPPMRDLQYTADEKHPLDRFYSMLLRGEYHNKRIRILHYGDSQIEGDRITSKVRHTLQYYFAGTGPGWQSITPLVAPFSIEIDPSPHWTRYPGFGRKDTSIAHDNYGPLITLSRYRNDDTTALPSVTIKPRGIAFSTAKKADYIQFHFSPLESPLKIYITQHDTLLDTLFAATGQSSFRFAIAPPFRTIHMEFDGESPDWYGFHADSETGLAMDNIPLRGSSGTFFNKMPVGEPEKYFTEEHVGLIILQFGGNTVPYIESAEHAARYGKWIQSNIAHLKKRFPKAEFLFIGPSDMAIKERTQMVTYPFLEDVRNALKTAAFEEGIAFWDIYEAMGGKNSMSSWVESDPPLAATDYVHFSPRGAALIGQWLSEAMIKDYELWKLNREEEPNENP